MDGLMLVCLVLPGAAFLGTTEGFNQFVAGGEHHPQLPTQPALSFVLDLL